MVHPLNLSITDKQILLEALLEYRDKIRLAQNALFTEQLVDELLNRLHESLEADELGE